MCAWVPHMSARLCALFRVCACVRVFVDCVSVCARARVCVCVQGASVLNHTEVVKLNTVGKLGKDDYKVVGAQVCQYQ